jgi:hypothetical protein
VESGYRKRRTWNTNIERSDEPNGLERTQSIGMPAVPETADETSSSLRNTFVLAWEGRARLVRSPLSRDGDHVSLDFAVRFAPDDRVERASGLLFSADRKRDACATLDAQTRPTH